MKYYVYISDSKVDMLLQQIPHSEKKKLASEFKVDLKVLGATWKRESEPEQGRISRLDWKPYTDKTSKANIVYFSGIAERSIIGLAGSTHHLMGGLPGPQEVKVRQSEWASSSPSILRWLEDLHLGLDDVGGRTKLQPKLRDNDWIYKMFVTAVDLDMKGPKQNLEFLAKRLFQGDFDGANPDLLHLPSVLHHYHQGKLWHMILGTPLYVAMVD